MLLCSSRVFFCCFSSGHYYSVSSLRSTNSSQLGKNTALWSSTQPVLLVLDFTSWSDQPSCMVLIMVPQNALGMSRHTLTLTSNQTRVGQGQNNLYVFNKTLKPVSSTLSLPLTFLFFPPSSLLCLPLALKGLVNVSKPHIRHTNQTINLKDTHRAPAGCYFLTPLLSVVVTPSTLLKKREGGVEGWLGVQRENRTKCTLQC